MIRRRLCDGPAPLGAYGYTAVDDQGNVWAGVEYIAQTCSIAGLGSAGISHPGDSGVEHGAVANFATRVM